MTVSLNRFFKNKIHIFIVKLYEWTFLFRDIETNILVVARGNW